MESILYKIENNLDYKSMSNKVTEAICDSHHNYLQSSLEYVNIESNLNSKIITVHNLPNSINALYIYEICVKKFPNKLKYLSIFEDDLNYIKKLPKGLLKLKIGSTILNMKLIKKGFLY
jgi:hypothetical protein